MYVPISMIIFDIILPIILKSLCSRQNKFKKKKTYYIRLRAFKLNGKEKVYGKWSVVKKIKMGK